MENGTAALNNSMMFPQNVRHSYPAILLLAIYPEELKTYVHTKMSTNVHSSITHNNYKVEIAQMPNSPTDEWAKISVVGSYNVILLSHERSTERCSNKGWPLRALCQEVKR